MPEAQIVDLTHSIRKFDPVHAAFVLRAAMDVFPKGTVHMIGVNAVETPDHPHRIVKLNDQYFIGADTGVFQLMGAKQPDAVFDFPACKPTRTCPPSPNGLCLCPRPPTWRKEAFQRCWDGPRRW